MKLRTKSVIVALCAGVALAASAPAASAADYLFANHVGPIYSGGDYNSGWPYLGAVTAISGASTGTAYTQVWVHLGGVRVSAKGSCNWAGCTAFAAWSGSYPNGYGTVHNHGNASPSYFNGVISG